MSHFVLQLVVNSVTPLSVEGDGVCRTRDMPKQLCLLMDEVYQCSGVWLLTGLNQSVYLVSVKLII